MTNKQVCKAFVRGAKAGRSLHIFIDDDTIYSYGKHFVLAIRRSDGFFVVNSRRYSATTSRHTGLIKTAISAFSCHYEMERL